MAETGLDRQPAISAILVNWNHGTFLQECLSALCRDGESLLNAGALEIVVVDNGSSDGSPEWLTQHYPGVRLLCFPDNRGFAAALNHGVRSTTGGLVLSLNPDVVVTPGFLEALQRALQTHRSTGQPRVGMAAPKLLRADAPTKLDSTGLFVDRGRRPYDRGQGEIDRGQYDMCTKVFGPCGAAALYRRDMLQEVANVTDPPECFDEAFFAYCEDADLAWRGQLLGWTCVYVPAAVATHVRGWGDTVRKRGHARKGSGGPRLSLRNRYLMTIKNDAWQHTVRDLPHILATELPRLGYLAFAQPETLLGLYDLARAWPSAVRKRRQIRHRQRVKDADLRHWFVPQDRPPVPPTDPGTRTWHP
jgi:GT2 family glycosyltransferase